jgi:RNA polymerase sigma-70 factor (ECF subfamily)
MDIHTLRSGFLTGSSQPWLPEFEDGGRVLFGSRSHPPRERRQEGQMEAHESYDGYDEVAEAGLPAAPPAVPTWEEIVDQQSDRVYRLAFRLTGNRHDAEDLTQEVFVRVFRSLSTYQPGTFEGWIHRITTNLFLDQARRKQRIRFDALSDERADRLHSALPSPDTAYADQTFDDDIERALSTLPPEFRAAVVLCDVEGLSYDEIAQILAAKLGTVRSRIHRGRAMLRAALAHRAPAEGRTRYQGPAASAPASTPRSAS